MAAIAKPDITFNLLAAKESTNVLTEQRVLFIGQQVGATAPSGQLITNIGVEGEEDTLFGRRCILSEMIRQFRVLNKVTTIDAIPYTDAGGSVKASGDIRFTGTATKVGEIIVFIQSQINHKFVLPVAVGTTALQLATELNTQINADNSILVTSALDVPNLGATITAANGGTEMNDLAILVTGLPVAGLNVVLFTFDGGTGDPDISAFGTVVGENRYQSIVGPYFGRITIKTFLDARFNVTDAIKDGVGFVANVATPANLKVDSLALNSQSMVLFGSDIIVHTVGQTRRNGSHLVEFKGSSIAQLVANRTLKLTLGQNIAQLLVGNAGSGNNFGGAWTAAVPYHNTPFPNIAPIVNHDGWTKLEQDDLNNNGVSFFGNNLGGTGVIVGDVVTTYQTNGIGQPDTAWKFLNTVDTGSIIREFYFNSNAAEYAQAVMTGGDVIPNVKQVNVSAFKAFQTGLYNTLATSPDFALAQAGNAAITFYKDNLVVTFDLANGLISVTMVVPVVSQVRTIQGTIQISFDIGSS